MVFGREGKGSGALGPTCGCGHAELWGCGGGCGASPEGDFVQLHVEVGEFILFDFLKEIVRIPYCLVISHSKKKLYLHLLSQAASDLGIMSLEEGDHKTYLNTALTQSSSDWLEGWQNIM